ncbi:MAG: hypothetical protein J0I34_13460 [Pseudonocardia sp.]|uniref:hypothetical protein n=1 Tax=unclassified Pseudonocardia TaxID=2619320 RepID=UPI001ACC96F2|nr:MULTISPECIES: hypothetical protein [unclassified Pseudonocardia]MBN9109779.1 hypothetical protein [Pseudonocardia sp.]
MADDVAVAQRIAQVGVELGGGRGLGAGVENCGGVGGQDHRDSVVGRVEATAGEGHEVQRSDPRRRPVGEEADGEHALYAVLDRGRPPPGHTGIGPDVGGGERAERSEAARDDAGAFPEPVLQLVEAHGQRVGGGDGVEGSFFASKGDADQVRDGQQSMSCVDDDAQGVGFAEPTRRHR